MDDPRGAAQPAGPEAKEARQNVAPLGREFHQDGFFQFAIPDDSLTVISLPNGARQVTGKAQVIPQGGNQGAISASLTFGGSGHLLTASESANMKRGMRPICQATKLLDPDPIGAAWPRTRSS